MTKKTDKLLTLTLEERSLLAVILENKLDYYNLGIKSECESHDSDSEFYIKYCNDIISLIESIMKKLGL